MTWPKGCATEDGLHALGYADMGAAVAAVLEELRRRLVLPDVDPITGRACEPCGLRGVQYREPT